MFRRCALSCLAAGSSAVKEKKHGSANASTLQALRTRDITLRIPTKDKRTRVVFCSTRHILQETIDRHDLVTVSGGNAAFLSLVGTHITFTNLLASLLDGEERVESSFTGDEATVHTAALALGECKAYLSSSYNAELIEIAGLQPFPLRIDRILYHQRQPFSSTVNAQYPELVSASASKDIGEREDGRRHAEVYTQKGTIPLSPTTPAEPLPPLYSLELQQVNPDKLVSFYSYNVTLHGYNDFRRSDGSVSALGLYSGIDSERLAALPARPRGDSSGSKAGDDDLDGKVKHWRDALRSVVPSSYGFLVQPLAAGNAVDWSLWKLQRAVVMAMANGGGDNDAFSVLRERAAEAGHTACQDTVSLVTGDYEGAFEAAVVARQCTQDPGKVAAVIEPIRKQLGIDDVRLCLDGKEANRTGLDFFCRCSTAGLLASLVNAPEEAVRSLEAENTFTCTYCSRVHHPRPEEWEHLHKVRRAQHGGGGSV